MGRFCSCVDVAGLFLQFKTSIDWAKVEFDAVISMDVCCALGDTAADVDCCGHCKNFDFVIGNGTVDTLDKQTEPFGFAVVALHLIAD